MLARAVGEEAAAGRRAPRAACPAARSRRARQTIVGGQIRRPVREEPVERVPRDEPPLEQRGEAVARAAIAELREHQRDVGLLSAQRAAGPHRSVIERLLDEPRHLGLVRHVEAGIEIGLERKLAQQRQAERVDRADRDVAEAIAQLEPARRSISDGAAGLAQLATIRSRISAAALRVNVIARMFGGSTPALSRLT